MRSILQAAKFLYSKESSSRPDEGEKSCTTLLPSSLHCKLKLTLAVVCGYESWHLAFTCLMPRVMDDHGPSSLSGCLTSCEKDYSVMSNV